MTSAAVPSAAIVVGIGFIIGMAIATMCLSLVACPCRFASLATTRVLLVRYGLKMVWIYASAIPAKMIQRQPCMNFPAKPFIRKAMGAMGASTVPVNSIPTL